MRITPAFGLLLAAAWLAAAPAAHGQSVVNGSFEIGTPADGAVGYTELSAGSLAMTGWTIGGGGIDWMGSYWQPSTGNRSIDLNAMTAGSVSQTGIVTVIGQQYRVTFDMAGNTDGGNTVKSLSVQATGGTAQLDQFDITGRSHTDMGWTTKTYDFVASGTLTTLTFTGLDNNPFGAAIDNVTIAPVPEPAGLLAVAVAGLAGRAVRRRAVAV